MSIPTIIIYGRLNLRPNFLHLLVRCLTYSQLFWFSPGLLWWILLLTYMPYLHLLWNRTRGTKKVKTESKNTEKKQISSQLADNQRTRQTYRGGSSPRILGGGALPHQSLHHRVHFILSTKPKKMQTYTFMIVHLHCFFFTPRALRS